jgi:hypothetical protein
MTKAWRDFLLCSSGVNTALPACGECLQKLLFQLKNQIKRIEVFGGAWGFWICPIGIQKYPIEGRKIFNYLSS